MARKVTITPEIILQNALEMVIDEGYQALSVHSLAKNIGCYTQPIVWHFENMEGLRIKLYEYALLSLNDGKDFKSGSDAFENMGSSYIETAIKKPNLFKFLYLGEGPVSKPYSLSEITTGKDKEELVIKISEELGLTQKQTVKVIQNTIVFSHGIATMIATGVFKTTKKDAMKLIKDASEAFIMKAGAGNE